MNDIYLSKMTAKEIADQFVEKVNYETGLATETQGILRIALADLIDKIREAKSN